MPYKTPDRTQETCTGAGAGSLTLTGNSPTNFLPLSANLVNGDTFPGIVVHKAGSEWQTGIWTYGGSTISLKRFYASSTGSPVSFTAGDKDVVVGPLGRSASWRVVAGSVDALPGDRLKVITSGGEVTITLPADPTDGEEDIVLDDPAGNWPTNNVIIDGNGAPFAGGFDTVRCSDQATVAIQFADGAWRVCYY
jgi:hypothetical protein